VFDLLPVPASWPYGLAVLAAGAVLCVAGARIMRIALGVGGFAVTGAVTAAVTALVTESPLWALVAFVVGGVVGGGLAVWLIVPGLFLLGAFCGYRAADLALPDALLVVPWVVAFITGMLFALMKERLLAATTAAAGALLVTDGLLVVLLDVPGISGTVSGFVEGPGSIPVVAVFWAALAIAGAIVQQRWERGRKRSGKDDR